MSDDIDFEEYERRREAISWKVGNIGRKAGNDDPEILHLRDYINGKDLREFAQALYRHESLPVCYALANDCQGIFPDSIFYTRDDAEKHLGGSFTEVRPVIVLDTTYLLTEDERDIKAATTALDDYNKNGGVSWEELKEELE